MSSVERNFMFRSTYAIIRKQAEEILNKLKEEIPKTLSQTYETGGYWHDNPQWDYTMEEQKQLNEKLAKMRDALLSVTYIDDLPGEYDWVQVGVCVEIEDLDNKKRQKYMIVGPHDVTYNPKYTPKDGFISYLSPLARFLIGKKVGQEITMQLPGRTRRVRITLIGPIQLED